MKKRLFALFLALATLASMVVAPAYAESAAPKNMTATTELCGCGCGNTLDEITWKPWAANPAAVTIT